MFKTYINLDKYIEMYLHSAELNNKRSSPKERDHVDSILKEREQLLGISGDTLDGLLDIVDRYAEDESIYPEVIRYYEENKPHL